MSLRPSLASPRARNIRNRSSKQRFAPKPPPQRGINPNLSTRQKNTRKQIFALGESQPVDLDAILQSAKSGSIARPARSTNKFAWDMSSPVANQRRILRQRELEDSRIESKPIDPLASPKRIRIPSAVPTAAMETDTEKLFNCSPMPSPQNSPRQGTMQASPVRTLTIDLDLMTTQKQVVDYNTMNETNVSQVSSPTSRTNSPRSPMKSPRSPLAASPNSRHGTKPALEPSVMISYVRDVQKGSPPRRIAVERKRVEYNQCNLTNMLEAAGIDIQSMMSGIENIQNGMGNIESSNNNNDEEIEEDATSLLASSSGGLSKNLPLEIFDNIDFEMYQPEEWIERVRQNKKRKKERKKKKQRWIWFFKKIFH
jgi:hypothetical protein